MKLGQVFKFDTDQAKGYAAKFKIHVFLGKTDHFRARDPYAFLFISSENHSGSCFPIGLADYDTFLDHDSFISCGKLVYYSGAYLRSYMGDPVGQLSKEHLVALRNHLVGHQVMPEWEIILACGALAAAI